MSQHFTQVDLRQIAHQAMEEYGFHSSFSPKVLKEVQYLNKNLKIRDDIVDLRALLWSSIDNEETQDFDQLEYCEWVQRKEIRVLVAIADVDHHVVKGSAIDHRAKNNATSVYTGVVVFPMLPEDLSNDLSSLREGQDRMAIVFEFFVSPDGSVRPKDLFRALVHNHAKLVYESTGDWLEGHGPMPEVIKHNKKLERQLRIQSEAAERLHTYRMRTGAVEFETVEARPIMKNGEIIGLDTPKKNKARLLIENFMVAANGVMVWFLEKHKAPLIQRIVREPKRWDRIREVAEDLGTILPPEPDSAALSEFLMQERTRDPEHFPDLSLTIVKLLGHAEYVLAYPGGEDIGHFGLAVKDYTHATAPNRRYPDLILQRLAKAIVKNQPLPYTINELKYLAQHCTQKALDAQKVERFMRKAAAAVLLQGRLGQVFDGIITGASPKGTYVRLLGLPAEGRVVRHFKEMDVGEKVRVRLIGVDPERAYIDFEGLRGRR